jgi:large subunit ribosomal protein L22
MATRMREKAAAREEAKRNDTSSKAIAKFIRISPYKVRQVLDVIRGKSYPEAVGILNNTNKAASPVLLKLLNSAAANAENNKGMDKNTLYVSECFADQGPTLKRIRPRAKGRAYRILKRTSHITIVLDAIDYSAE